MSKPEPESGEGFSSSAGFSTLSIKFAGQINESQAMLALAGIYAKNKKWLDQQLEMARNSNVPIIAVRPKNGGEVPGEISQCAKLEVDWEIGSIIDAIRKITY